MQELLLIILMIFFIGNIQIKIGKFEIKVIGVIPKFIDLL